MFYFSELIYDIAKINNVNRRNYNSKNESLECNVKISNRIVLLHYQGREQTIVCR